MGKEEKEPAPGCFGFGKSDNAFMRAVDDALAAYLGSGEHRSLMKSFGFTEVEIDRIALKKSQV